MAMSVIQTKTAQALDVGGGHGSNTMPSFTTTTGNMILLLVSMTTNPGFTATDNLNGSYSQIFTFNGTAGVTLAAFIVPITSAGSTTITVNQTNETFIDLVAIELSGAANSIAGSAAQPNVLDGGATGTDINTSGTFSATSDGILIGMTMIYAGAGNVGVVGTAFTSLALLADLGSNPGLSAEYKLLSSTGTVAGTWTIDGTNSFNDWNTAAFVLKQIGGGPGVSIAWIS